MHHLKRALHLYSHVEEGNTPDTVNRTEDIPGVSRARAKFPFRQEEGLSGFVIDPVILEVRREIVPNSENENQI